MNGTQPIQPFGAAHNFGQDERVRRLELMLREHQSDFNIHSDYRVGQMENEYNGADLVRSVLYTDSTRTTKIWQQEFTYVNVLGMGGYGTNRISFEKTIFYRNGKPFKAFVREFEYHPTTGFLLRIKTRESVQGV